MATDRAEIDSHGTKLPFLEIDSNPESSRLFLFILFRRRSSPDLESGQAILICEIFALNHADILHLEKRLTVMFCALKRETRP